MSGPILYILDVFAEQRYAGNQLAVFRHVDGISDGEMQQIAREMNFSETTFILAEEPEAGGYPVRIFTPGEEVPFAGHPTIGTAFIIQREIIGNPVESLTLNLKVGQIPVAFEYANGAIDKLWMKQKPPKFGKKHDAAEVAPVVGLMPADLDARFPVQEVSTGLPALIVPLKNLKALQRAQTVREKYFELVKTMEARAVLVFCPEARSSDNQLSVRVFVDFFGIPEDPATGSANGCLAGYLARYRYFGDESVRVRVEQGYDMGRPSLLFLEAGVQGQTIEVHVGGRAVLIAKGEWLASRKNLRSER
jgi:trans-2,3-dihydro-3-hydroxyanthranilate isomerase